MSTSPQLVPILVRARDPRRRPRVPTAAVVRLAIHQHRIVLALAVPVLAVLTLWTRDVAAQAVAAHAQLAAGGCLSGPSAASEGCLDLVQQVQSASQAVRHLQYALVALPVLAGLFFGAPLVAREFEQGTHRLAFSQSVSPQQWLRGQLALACGAALLVGTAGAALGVWLHDAVGPAVFPGDGAFMLLPYNADGPVLAASTLLAVALGVVAGTLTRRTLAAMAAMLGLYGAAMAALTWLRQYLQPVRTLLTHHGYDLAPDDWLLRDGVQLADGHRLLYAQCGPGGCPDGAPTFEDYHTADQLWPMQWAEAGLMVLLAAAALALAHRALRRPRG
ncbi:ABC transporter permease subunit [Streptacidiphilus anmyonensis]|uniref:ABC transporter permease subunit n=1 Tax=Streptacidiphilus anmyonensis TaxID=405782 RepID=UPI000693655D|nr:ABC transporter permease subunit [Streptacidiphilus anmyonensis]